MTHDYKRNGTTTLFAAFDVLEGKVIGRCMQRHRHQEFIRFLNAVEREVPAGKTVPRHPRQLRHSQAPQSDRMAGASSALELPFHAHLGQLAQRLNAEAADSSSVADETKKASIAAGFAELILVDPLAIEPGTLSQSQRELVRFCLCNRLQ